MVSDRQLTQTKAIQQRTGPTFHVATKLLPERVRHATYVLYAFFRVADDVVDDPEGPPPETAAAMLDRIQAAALGDRETDDPVLQAFQEIKTRYDIPDEEVETFIDAMKADTAKDRYASHEELSTYLRGSSVAVGNMMTAIMEPDDPEAALPHAKELAEAFQLTNFLRDVREDMLDYGRIYIPRETLDAHGVDEADIENLRFSPDFERAMNAELHRTELKYHEGVKGIELLPADCRFAVLLAAVLYAEHHQLIRRRGCDVLSAHPSLSKARRLSLVATTWYHYRRTGDAVDAFYRASSIEHPDEKRARRDAFREQDDDLSVVNSVTSAAGTVVGLLRTHIPR